MAFTNGYYVKLWDQLRSHSPQWLQKVASSPYDRLRLTFYNSPPYMTGRNFDDCDDYTMSSVEMTLPILANVMLIDQQHHRDEEKRLQDMLYHYSSHTPSRVTSYDSDEDEDNDAVSVALKDGEVKTVMKVAEDALKKADRAEDWETYDAMTSILVQCRKALNDK